MKKLFLSLLIIFSFVASGQSFSKYALGLRMGYNLSPYLEKSKEISYQLITSKNNRIELDLGRYNYEYSDIDICRLIGIYQWGSRLIEGFGWYTGIGVGVVANIKESYFLFFDLDSLDLIFAAQAGIQYRFIGFPFLISLDFRPEYSNTMLTGLGNLSFSARFTF